MTNMAVTTVFDDEITIIEPDEQSVVAEHIQHYVVRVYIRAASPQLGRVVIPGLPDEHRMRRALCYFDVALFNDGKHRDRLLSRTFEDTRTGNMYRAMVDAYRAFVSVADAPMFIFDIERTPPPLVARPTVSPCSMEATPLDHSLRYCVACFRVEELARDGRAEDIFLCSRCQSK